MTTELKAFNTMVQEQKEKTLELEREMNEELAAANGSPSKIAMITRKYNKLFEQVASKILEKDLVFKLMQGHKVPLTSSVKEDITLLKKALLDNGVIETCDAQRTCVVCGRLFEPGEVGAEVKGDGSTCVCMECAGKDVVLNDPANLFIQL